jgi:hypothetical protein
MVPSSLSPAMLQHFIKASILSNVYFFADDGKDNSLPAGNKNSALKIAGNNNTRTNRTMSEGHLRKFSDVNFSSGTFFVQTESLKIIPDLLSGRELYSWW